MRPMSAGSDVVGRIDEHDVHGQPLAAFHVGGEEQRLHLAVRKGVDAVLPRLL